MTDPLFSIITVTRNNLEGLRKTHESLRAQTAQDFEWIVIDGDSADGTREFLFGNSAASWLSEPDRGLYDAMNKGLDRSGGAYVLFLNAGDRLAAPDALAHLAAAIAQQTPAPDFIHCDSFEDRAGRMHYKPSRPLKRSRGAAKMLRMITHHQAMIYRRETFGNLRYDLRYAIAADYDFTLRFLQKAQHTLHHRASFCVFESGGLSQQNARTGRREQFEIRARAGLLSPLRNRAYYAAQTALWTLRLRLPLLYWRISRVTIR